MIRSFRCRETERVFEGEVSSEFPADIQDRARRKLFVLDSAVDLTDLGRVPGNRLEKLGGDRTGRWSIRINDQWRICFCWERGADEVEITDYH
jgi:proteic killer suppression protein